MRRTVVGLVAAGLLVAGCGGGGGTAAPTSSPATEPTTTEPTTTTSAAAGTSTPAPVSPSASAPTASRTGPPEPTPVGDTSADGLWGRAAEVVCADMIRTAPKPAGPGPAEQAQWVADRAFAAVDRLEAVPGNAGQGKELRDILYAIGTQSQILISIYQGGSGVAGPLAAERERSIARLGRYAAVLKAPSCVDVIKPA